MKKPEWILVIAIILCLVMPPILTKISSCIYFNKDTGEIGDTIGGLTAPIIGLLNAILVYLALKSQIEANEKIQKRQDEQEAKFEEKERDETRTKKITEIIEKISFIKTALDNFYAEDTEIGTTGKGEPGLKVLINALKNDKLSPDPSKFKTYPSAIILEKLLKLFDILIVETTKEDTLSVDDKVYLIFQLESVFLIKLAPHFKDKEGIPEQLTLKIKKIADNIYEFEVQLRNNNI